MSTTKKTFTTTMPDRVGAFMLASKRLSELGLNITRVSYNKAVDTHMLFLEVEGSEDCLKIAESELGRLGYLQNEARTGNVILLEFHLKDEPKRLQPVLELINSFRFNISYMSSQQNLSGYQDFKIGIFVNSGREISEFMKKASLICPVKVLHYDRSEKILDNTVFYLNFAENITEKMNLGAEEKAGLMVAANQIMQTMDERNEPYYKTFDYITRFAEHVECYKGDRFAPRVSEHTDALGGRFVLFEPPCGSNICVMETEEGYLFVDSSFSCYQKEFWCRIHEELPNTQKKHNALLLTHPDEDHCGFLGDFDAVYLSEKAKEKFDRENSGMPAYREENPLHRPYAYISKILTAYRPPVGDNFCLIKAESGKENDENVLSYLSTIHVMGYTFEVYEGKGGHVCGETVYLERSRRLLFTGDIFVNVKDLTPEQKAFNKLAPYLMTSVDTDPVLAKREREALFALLSPGQWQIVGGHGGVYTVTISD